MEFTHQNGKSASDIEGLHRFVKELGDVTQQQQNLSLHMHLTERIRKLIAERRFHEQLEVEQSLFISQDTVGIGGLSGSSYSAAGCYSGGAAGSGDGRVALSFGSSSAVSDFVEEKMGFGSSPWKVLRLMCLYTQTVSSIKLSRYEGMKNAFLQTYGYHHIHTLLNAEQAGLLRYPESKSPWNFSKISKLMNLYIDNDDENNPKDIAYTFAWYEFTLLNRKIIKLN